MPSTWFTGGLPASRGDDVSLAFQRVAHLVVEIRVPSQRRDADAEVAGDVGELFAGLERLFEPSCHGLMVDTAIAAASALGFGRFGCDPCQFAPQQSARLEALASSDVQHLRQ